MSALSAKLLKIAVVIAVLGGLYAVALVKHAERDELRRNAVDLTPACKAKLERYGLVAGETYSSPYIVKMTGAASVRSGYSEADIRAIGRGCNIISDLQGHLATTGTRERWHASRYVRSTHTTCAHCHQDVGDKQDAEGNRLLGSNNLGASWVMADMYDRFTGLLLPQELRQMQCYINSSNGFKPNAADDVIRDVTAYTRFISGAVDQKIANRYPEQGLDEIPASATRRRGDDYVRGAQLYRDKCASCHGPQALGTVVDGRAIYPAIAGPNSFSSDSRMNFAMVHTIIPGFICRNMPPGAEGSLEPQQCRDIAYYLSTLPRPAGDRDGPLLAVWHQLMMTVMPPLMRYAEQIGGNEPRPADE